MKTERSFRASLAAMLGICLVIMLIAIDSSVVGTAMPRIVAELRGYDLYPWIASAYLMGNIVLIPVSGRMGDLYGRKPFVIAAVILFTLASAACGMAQTMLQLVIARGIQGMGGGLMVGVAFACVPDLFPDRQQRVRWQVLLSSTFGISMALGPSLGGWLTEHAGWRSVFYVNMPIALVALPVIWRFLPHIVHHTGTDRSIDWQGTALLAFGIAALLLGSEYGQSHGFANLPTLGYAVLCAAGLWAFVRRQYRTSAPIIPPDVLGNRDAQKLMALGMLTGMSMFMLVFYVPLMLQGGFGQSPKEAGLVLTPLLVCITIGSIINGRLLQHVPRAERVICWGQAGTAIASALLLLLKQDSTHAQQMIIFALCGLSFGFQLPNLTLQMMSVCGRKSLGVGTALVQSTRMIGSMIGVGFASLLVNTAYNRHISAALAEAGITDGQMQQLLDSPQVLIRIQDQHTLLARASELGLQAQPLLDQARHGLVLGVHGAFILCTLLAIASILISRHLPRYEIRGQKHDE